MQCLRMLLLRSMLEVLAPPSGHMAAQQTADCCWENIKSFPLRHHYHYIVLPGLRVPLPGQDRPCCIQFHVAQSVAIELAGRCAQSIIRMYRRHFVRGPRTPNLESDE